MKRALLVSTLILAACTTVSNGPMQRVFVDSEPQGADVEVARCGAMATKTIATPGVVWVSRRSTQCEVVLRKSGFRTERVRLPRHVSGAMHRYADAADIYASIDSDDPIATAIFLTGFVMLPSFAVDAASGSMFELQPSHVFVTLTAAAEDWREQDQTPPAVPRK